MKSNDLTAYVDRLYRAVLRKTREAYAAEELAQGTFLAALSALSKGKEPEHVWAWLYRIMSNIHCDRLRDKYNKPQISFDDVPFDIPEETFDDDSEETLADVRRRAWVSGQNASGGHGALLYARGDDRADRPSAAHPVGHRKKQAEHRQEANQRRSRENENLYQTELRARAAALKLLRRGRTEQGAVFAGRKHGTASRRTYCCSPTKSRSLRPSWRTRSERRRRSSSRFWNDCSTAS